MMSPNPPARLETRNLNPPDRLETRKLNPPVRLETRKEWESKFSVDSQIRTRTALGCLQEGAACGRRARSGFRTWLSPVSTQCLPVNSEHAYAGC